MELINLSFFISKYNHNCKTNITAYFELNYGYVLQQKQFLERTRKIIGSGVLVRN